MRGHEYLQKCTDMKCQTVQMDESVFPASQDEVMEVEHLLAEPRDDHVPMDAVLYFHEENVGKCLDVENLSCGFEFGLKTSIGGLNSQRTLNVNDELKLEVLDGLLDDVEIEDLDATDGFSGACEDYFLDYEFANKAVGQGSGSCEGSLFQNSSSDGHSPGLSRSNIVVDGVSESIKVPTAECECENDSLDKKVTCELLGAFRNNPCQPSSGDCKYHNSLNVDHLNESDNNHHLESGILSQEREEGSVEECQTSAHREKRFRKPTQRYIEEFSNLRSKEKVSSAAIKNKRLTVTSQNELHRIRFRALRKIPGQKSNSGTSHVALPGLGVHKRHTKKEQLEQDEESFASESEDDCLTPKISRRNDRRKHQRLWTLSEVIKLIDGISEYGVGRWTNIKRVLFSSSSYRTPIDLRDKWRNLLRASSAQKFNKKEAEQDEERTLRSLPITLVRRVRELAKIHPYPRVRGSKKSCVAQVGSSALPTQSKGIPVTLKRNVCRKKCT